MPKQPLPKIYCDVHIKPGAIEGCRKQQFKCVRIPESKYRDLDEHDFFRHLYAENALLATGDLKFTQNAYENNFRHAGILEIPPDFDSEDASESAEVLATLAKELFQQLGKHALRRHIIYLAHDGVRIIDDKGRDELFLSWERLEQVPGI